MVSLLLFSSLVWLAVFHWQTQRALQWWFDQQQQWLYREAEQLRNGPLQETFVMRRQLELHPEPDCPLTAHPNWMAQVDQLNGQLMRLSDDLSPPYLETSLPLAIQAWVKDHGLPIAALNLPERWQPEQPTRVSLILAALDHLQRLSSQHAGILTELSMQQSPQHAWADLIVRIDYPTVAAARQVGRSPEMAALMRAFQVLAPGRCTRQQQQQQIRWRFRWRRSPHFLAQPNSPFSPNPQPDEVAAPINSFNHALSNRKEHPHG